MQPLGQSALGLAIISSLFSISTGFKIAFKKQKDCQQIYIGRIHDEPESCSPTTCSTWFASQQDMVNHNYNEYKKYDPDPCQAESGTVKIEHWISKLPDSSTCRCTKAIILWRVHKKGQKLRQDGTKVSCDFESTVKRFEETYDFEGTIYRGQSAVHCHDPHANSPCRESTDTDGKSENDKGLPVNEEMCVWHYNTAKFVEGDRGEDTY
jgi:hypothetical protein